MRYKVSGQVPNQEILDRLVDYGILNELWRGRKTINIDISVPTFALMPASSRQMTNASSI